MYGAFEKMKDDKFARNLVKKQKCTGPVRIRHAGSVKETALLSHRRL